jgi:hypothetical protein
LKVFENDHLQKANQSMKESVRPHKIISGGQTGVDRAALDAAIYLGIPHGGTVPKGRLAEDGIIPSCYTLIESASPSYPLRTEKNVIDADATLLISFGPLSGGSAYTVEMAVKHHKPWFHFQFKDIEPDRRKLNEWFTDQLPTVLNIAGPRESNEPGIYACARQFLTSWLAV